MGIESPTTYGDWYWKNSVEARQAFDETIEDALSPTIAGLLSAIPEQELLPPVIQAGIASLIEPHSPGLGGFLTSAGGEFAAEVVKDAISPAMSMLKRSINRKALETWLTSEQASTLSARKKIDDEYFYLLLNSEGYENVAADALHTSLLPYPTVPEIMQWARYQGNFDNIRGPVWEKFDVPADDFALWEWLSQQHLTTLQAQELLKRGYMTPGDFFGVLGRIGWNDIDRDALHDLAYSIPNAMLLVQGSLMHDVSQDTILQNISKADIHPEYAQTYLDAILTKPASQDIVAYHLRQDPSLSGLDDDLTKIGIHPYYHDVYKTLAYQIPPVADIITMAVREAFTPEVAARFGQYEDFPDDLEKFAGMKGLSKEWAQRYWAAHWNLPSPQQGFEMLHRGVIDHAELNMLLRAQDVMPFWRDKLTQIAYRRLTRVDIRRMYRQGVLTEQEVYSSYLDYGYDDENAKRMATFTVKQTLSSQAKFTSSDIVKAFTGRMIDAGVARSLLRDIGVRDEDATYIISTAEYKRLWAFTDEQISGVRNLFKKRVYDDNQARDKLAKLNLPADQINVLMQQWYFEKIEELDATWTTAQTLKFLKRKIITEQRARQELFRHGYNDERINVLFEDIKWTPPVK